MIFSELENQNQPEILELKKKYGFLDVDKAPYSMVESAPPKSDINMNTLYLNFNNFNMNLDFNNSLHHNQILEKKDIIPNYNYYQMYPKYIDNIEAIINKSSNIYFHLIKIDSYEEVINSYESNIIRLPRQLYQEYKYQNLLIDNITVIVIIFNKEYDNFVGFGKLLKPLNNIDVDETEGLYMIKWLWKNNMHYSEVSHLMNRADHDHFLKEGRNGCPIDKDLGNYICRLMIKRLSKKEIDELNKEKQIFKRRLFLDFLQNSKKNKNYYDVDDEEEEYYYQFNNSEFYYEGEYYDYSSYDYPHQYFNEKERNHENRRNYFYEDDGNWKEQVSSIKRKREKRKERIKKHERKNSEKKHRKRKRSRSRSRSRKHRRDKHREELDSHRSRDSRVKRKHKKINSQIIQE